MHSFCVAIFFQSLVLTSFASPLIQKRYDLDGNGTPDWCYVDSNGVAHCLTDTGSWTTFATATFQSSTASTAGFSSPLAPTKIFSSSYSTSTLTSQTASSSTQAVLTTTVSTVSAGTVASSTLPTATLPSPSVFQAQNGTKWSIQYVGDIGYTGTIGTQDLGADKCRSSVLGGKTIWNCGDMECQGNWQICGFTMGAAFYGTDSVMTINTSAYSLINDYTFAQPWSGDAAPVSPQWTWGMDTSNVAPVNDTHGIAFAWEIWRGAPDGSIVERGNAVNSVTLGPNAPIATRMGPLLTDASAISIGLLAILRDGDYIYTYTTGGPSGVIVGRVPALNDAAFTASNHEFLAYSPDPSATPSWVKGVPSRTSNDFGVTTGSNGAKFGCGVYGSVFYNNYLKKYMIVCDAYLFYLNFFLADNPWGPWSEQYQLLNGGWKGYGTMAHPEFSPGGSHKELFISQGPNGPFNMFKVTFDY